MTIQDVIAEMRDEAVTVRGGVHAHKLIMKWADTLTALAGAEQQEIARLRAVEDGWIAQAAALADENVKGIEANIRLEREVARLRDDRDCEKRMRKDSDDYAATVEEEVARLKEWREAIIDAAVVDWVYREEHDTNPRKAVHDLLCHQQVIACDPRVSTTAKAWEDWVKELEGEVARLKAELEKVTHERDLAWGDLGFTKNDLGTALYRAEAAEAALAQVYERTAADGDMADRAVHDFVAAHLPVPSTPHEEE